MEDEEDGLVVRQALLGLDELLGVTQDAGGQLHVAGGVDAVHVAEGGGDGEALGGQGGQRLVHLQVGGTGTEWQGVRDEARQMAQSKAGQAWQESKGREARANNV